jgi:threonine aldolase
MAHNGLIDLYSDTQTRPSLAMRRAMADAEVGDEQRGEDPTTKRLEERVADLLGKEAAVFLPSGTMCNQIAVAVHCSAGDEVVAADTAHVFFSEAGGAASLARAQTWPIKSDMGLFTADTLKANLRDHGNRYQPRSRLLVVEQTANMGGGRVWPIAQINEVASVARGHGMQVHMDGARLLNAVVASGIAARTHAASFDSAWIDLSKGLGCPIGGVLAGSTAFVHEAWRWKQRVGGAFRQSGMLAAAGLYALDHNIELLAHDHANARLLAERIAAIPGLALSNGDPQTNIVFFRVEATGKTSAQVCADLLKRNVRMGAFGGTAGRIRCVTHLDVSTTDIERAATALAEVMKAK